MRTGERREKRFGGYQRVDDMGRRRQDTNTNVLEEGPGSVSKSLGGSFLLTNAR